MVNVCKHLDALKGFSAEAEALGHGSPPDARRPGNGPECLLKLDSFALFLDVTLVSCWCFRQSALRLLLLWSAEVSEPDNTQSGYADHQTRAKLEPHDSRLLGHGDVRHPGCGEWLHEMLLLLSPQLLRLVSQQVSLDQVEKW